MNLPDLVRRKDRAADIHGEIAPVEPRIAGVRQRAIEFQPGARLMLRRADEYSALWEFPRAPGWSVSQGGVRVSLAADGAPPITLGEASCAHGETLAAVALDWPAAAAATPFDLLIEPLGARPATLCVGPLFDPRAKLRAFFEGRGVEVGPGLNPHVKPSACVDVSYVEEMPPDAWRETYAKNKTPPPELPPEVLARYRIGSATTLDHIAPESLDFVFSNHVFEHLMNPLQVLRNWLARVRKGGVVLGVAPDARFTFDLRQPFSTLSEFLAEDARGTFDIPDEKYERWRRYSFPRHATEDLKRRKYSIHLHYYTPEVFRLLFDQLHAEGRADALHLNTEQNNKDFGFILQKP